MRITVGLSLDGPHHPPLLADRTAALGEAHVGPQGFLSLLETRLGLQGPPVPEAIRVAQYAARLAAANDGTRFFSDSFVVDRIGVARTLLRWRDELVAGGWTAASRVGVVPRLSDLALVESQVTPLAPASADRLQGVLATLALRGAPGLASIRLLEAPEEWPSPWPAVFESLAKRGVIIERASPPDIHARGDLATLLAFLKGGAARPAAGDGSLVIVQAQSDLEAAEVVATWLATSARDAVVIDPGLDNSLLRSLGSRGHPVQQSAPASSAGPALQVLGLALALRWSPFDPLAALQLVTLPGGPIPRWIGKELAATLQAAPGHGGKPWADALEAIAAASRRYAAAEGNDESAEVSRNRRLIDQWLGQERFDPREGMPSAVAINVCRSVSLWARTAQRRAPDDNVLNAAAAVAADLASALEHLGQARVSRLLLEACLADVSGAGAARGLPSQTGHHPLLREPGALVGPVSTLVWWNFIDEAARGCAASPWRHEERAALRNAGVQLDDVLGRHVRRVHSALGALTWVRDRLAFVIPGRRCGNTVSPHPLMGIVTAAFQGDIAPLCAEVRDWVDGTAPLPLANLDPVDIGFRTLPASRRWWSFPAGALPPRDRESFTSLDALIHHPFVWVLRYHARISRGFLEELPDGNLLLGSLSHRLFEELLVDEELVQRSKLDRIAGWITSRTQSLLEQEGSPLLRPGREPDRQRLVTCTTKAAQVLVAEIRNGRWKVTGTEVERAGAFAGLPLAGTLDILLRTDDGRAAVVDIKWGGRRYKAEEIRTLASLQLALYGHLVRQETGAWPHLAYLIVEDGEILHPAGPGGLSRSRDAAHGTRLDSYWDALLETYKWRREQLDRGLVEVTSANTEPDEQSEPPETALPPSGPWRWGDFLSLTGWIDDE